MLFFVMTSTVNLIGYQNPQITQYQIYDQRNDGRVVNYGQSYADVIFGIYNPRNKSFEVPDPRICTFDLQLIHLDWDAVQETGHLGIEVLKELDFEQISAETHPFLFEEGGYLTTLNSVDGLYSIADKSEVNLINHYD